ncbi:hypothetical protein C9374_005369 [Naegleria lovaniensis]|uniref:Uncharacterized protein n=2 Tax=Naegleria lovaniensis TaxID=51637 RepID=A0AA88GLX4_NAELO|nr:uncharacterized protein C9374_009237 [Naegleria lovaniensis]XP_044547216.1 uncharacterized protein C9374_006525 [Naegleria lovaniensis]XP_044547846.1 uncharacterized protein C9374_005369 [Naegleria lovaniensis]KAG2377326.1 hypothetical protein C9374_009237 [Naegleria lovaniensis]KAG2381536.1 hypothetical protein C9374_006525 [Naegleria lovaniensis]KAG2382167.1 hypothetical protein C9374_005369 [Naegleria lovaniensis]
MSESLPDWFNKGRGKPKQQVVLTEATTDKLKRKIEVLGLDLAQKKRTPLFALAEASKTTACSQLWSSIISSITKQLQEFNYINQTNAELNISLTLSDPIHPTMRYTKFRIITLDENNNMVEKKHNRLSIEEVERNIINTGLSKKQIKKLYETKYIPFSDRTISKYRKGIKDEIAKEMIIIKSNNDIKGFAIDPIQSFSKLLTNTKVIEVIRSTGKWLEHAPISGFRSRKFGFNKKGEFKVYSMARVSTDAHKLSRKVNEILCFLGLVICDAAQHHSNYKLLAALPKNSDNHCTLLSSFKPIESLIAKFESHRFIFELPIALFQKDSFLKNFVKTCTSEKIIIRLQFNVAMGGDLKNMLALQTDDKNRICFVCPIDYETHKQFLFSLKWKNNNRAQEILKMLFQSKENTRKSLRETIEGKIQIETWDCFTELFTDKGHRHPGLGDIIFANISILRRIPDILHQFMRLGENHLQIALHAALKISKQCQKELKQYYKDKGYYGQNDKINLMGDDVWETYGNKIIEDITQIMEKHASNQQLSTLAYVWIGKVTRIFQAGSELVKLLVQPTFCSDNDLHNVAKKIDHYISVIVPVIGDTIGTYWKMPYYLHILQEHVIMYLFIYRTLYPFAMTVHERLNKYGKDMFAHTMRFGGNGNPTRIYRTSSNEQLVEDRYLATLNQYYYLFCCMTANE